MSSSPWVMYDEIPSFDFAGVNHYRMEVTQGFMRLLVNEVEVATPSGDFGLDSRIGFVSFGDPTNYALSESRLSVVDCGFEQTNLLYFNDFESPAVFRDTTGRDVSQQSVDSLYSRPDAPFQQVATVETLENDGGVAFGAGYEDPQGLAGSHSLGMLSSAQEDRLALQLDVADATSVVVQADISAIDLDGSEDRSVYRSRSSWSDSTMRRAASSTSRRPAFPSLRLRSRAAASRTEESSIGPA